ncbi:PIG-L family deacetylase [Tsukamurella serpentis]
MATVVALHAHPDDECIFTGGTLAKLAAQGHRVVLVVATDGMMHGDDEPHPSVRLDELAEAATALGVSEVHWLGYADSGHGRDLHPDPCGRVRLAQAGVDEPAGKLAKILDEQAAELLIGYDAAGGYGHRDHLAVHAIARRAAGTSGVRLVEATAPRERVVRALAAAARLRLIGDGDAAAARTWFTPADQVTHRIDVRRFVTLKQRALAAHRTEIAKTGRMAQMMRLLLRLPAWAIAPVAGTEYFHEPAAQVRSDRLL